MADYTTKKTPSFNTSFNGNSAEGNPIPEGMVKNHRLSIEERDHAGQGQEGTAPAVFQK